MSRAPIQRPAGPVLDSGAPVMGGSTETTSSASKVANMGPPFFRLPSKYSKSEAAAWSQGAEFFGSGFFGSAPDAVFAAQGGVGKTADGLSEFVFGQGLGALEPRRDKSLRLARELRDVEAVALLQHGETVHRPAETLFGRVRGDPAADAVRPFEIKLGPAVA